MLNFFRSFFKLPELRAYEIIYRYGSGYYFSRTTVAATGLYEAARAFDTDQRFDNCHRVSCTLIP
jgi:hypothetical protein